MLANFSNFSSVNAGGSSGLTTAGGLHQGHNMGGNSGLVTSHSSGGNSGLQGSSNMQNSGTLGSDPLKQSSLGSIVLPASPLSFSSSNPNLSGSSGLTSIGRQGGSGLMRFELEDASPRPQFQQLQQQVSIPTAQFSQQQQTPQVKQLQEQPEQHQEQGNVHGNGQPHLQVKQLLGLGQQVAGSGNAHNMQGKQVLGAGNVQQQLQSSQSMASVKLEPTQSEDPIHQQQHLTAAKLEPKVEEEMHHQMAPHGLQRPDSMVSPHLQRREILHLQRQHSQQLQALNLLQQQRLLQQQQQQHQLLQTLPQHLQRQQQQQLQHNLQQQNANLQLAVPSKQPAFEAGACARRLMQYMYHQRHRPADNDISFWRKFVVEFFGPRAKKRWCVSVYGNGGRQPTGVFPQDVWQCEICGTKPGRGFETTVEVLPRLCKIKHDSGILEELLFVDLPHEYRLNSGLMVLEYGKAIQESIFEQLRVVRDGQLRIIFSSDLKIVSWEFCAKSHEELLPRRLIVPQVTQLATISQKYQTTLAQNGSSGLSSQELQSNCQMFVTSSRQLARNLEVPTVNDLGYTKRYVRCLQISEVVNSMKDLIDFSRENGIGPRESLINFPRRNVNVGGIQNNILQQEQNPNQTSVSEDRDSFGVTQQNVDNQSSNNLGGSLTEPVANTNMLSNYPSMVRQNSFSSLQNCLQNNVSRSLASASHSSGVTVPTMQASQTNPLSFQNVSSMSATLQPSNLNNFPSLLRQNSLSSAARILQQPSLQSGQLMHNEPQNVHQFMQEMSMTNQLNGGGQFQQGAGGGTCSTGNIGGSVGSGLSSLSDSNTMANGSGTMGNSNGIAENRLGNSSNLGGIGNFISKPGGNIITGLGGGGMRTTGTNLSVMNALGGRLNLASMAQQQNFQAQDPSQSLHHDLAGNDILNGGATGGFGSLDFNWKAS
ncbi:hypothetical protein O6H91_02G114700 [Diphasiastrum complanatum]|uniref:Uncharacterized protein n=11 Tax=Diphasiastrum complanatum TaxID=34168 RepID=A0ACC2EJZ4_DIPCM|nr:hypothetical protein O6H91_02G114700 [Diphasiastrum complanatum]KAJ7566689.1 hypothetical protein O6H91_02G114700 [Diphasiastrum complanatum]KAJ7566690.1 hypothetical protein O6H91_02G114700 [Diphasiastrum complanatum]KAJ7566691.1 hypothetical protein O6H91_02G114700 [Diphasiastrum complanatum]KAJ7566692.1 hypothetical protein O6H91_02G114700 [Diphasiastrum complanatum]